MIEFNLFWFTMLQMGNYLDYHTTKRFPYGADMEGNLLMVFYSNIRGVSWGQVVKEFKGGIGILLCLAAYLWLNNGTAHQSLPLITGVFVGISCFNIQFLKQVNNLNYYQFRKLGEKHTFTKEDILIIKVFFALMVFNILAKNISEFYGILYFIKGLGVSSALVFSFLIVRVIGNKVINWWNWRNTP